MNTIEQLEWRRLLAGDLDGSFGIGGVFEAPFVVTAVVAGNAGSPTLLVGDDGIAKLSASGGLDLTFSGDGVVEPPAGTTFDAAAYDAATGRIVGAYGATDGDGDRTTSIRMLQSNGSPDASFGNSGIVSLAGLAVPASTFTPTAEAVSKMFFRDDGGLIVFSKVDYGTNDDLATRILAIDLGGDLLGSLSSLAGYQVSEFTEVFPAAGGDVYVFTSSSQESGSGSVVGRYGPTLALIENVSIFSDGSEDDIQQLLDVRRDPTGGARMLLNRGEGDFFYPGGQHSAFYEVRPIDGASGTPAISGTSTESNNSERRLFEGILTRASAIADGPRSQLLSDSSYSIAGWEHDFSNVNGNFVGFKATIRHFLVDGTLDESYAAGGDLAVSGDVIANADDGTFIVADDADNNGSSEVRRFTPPDVNTISIQIADHFRAVTIVGADGPDDVTVALRTSDGRLVVRTRDFVRSLPPSVGTINFLGFGGDDILTVGESVHSRVWALLGAGDDVVALGSGVPASYIEGGDGNDSLTGGDGSDTFLGDRGDDDLLGNGGVDWLFGMGGNDELTGGLGNDRLEGGKNNDILDGSAGKDDLFGNAGDDSLSGARDNDRLFGGEGADNVSGGGGNDIAAADDRDEFSAVEQFFA